MADLPSHHLIYGTCADYLTGETVVDTDDERIRQDLARYLVENRGYDKRDIHPRHSIETLFAGQFVVSKIDFVLVIAGRRFLLVRYGPGSLVTRERAAVAAARVLDPDYQIPLAVVTNGRDAELLDVASGRVLGEGMEAIPSRHQAEQLVTTLAFPPPPDPGRREKELRILNAFDVEICCAGGPCALPGAREG
ncbi:MAG: type I restriction enzyme HsdR N-terminal domain-containing protein [Thermodesulfobacteriota bacterium]